MSCSRRWQNLHGTGSGDAGESLDGNESIFSQRTHPFEPLLDDVQVAKLLGLHQSNRSRVLPDRDSDCRLTKQVRRYIGAGQFGNHESPYAG